MNRRQCLQSWMLSGAVALLPGAILAAPGPRARSGASIVIHDTRFAEARRYAAGARHRVNAPVLLDCAQDAALLWYSNATTLRAASLIHGMTQRADALVLADLGQREGWRLRITRAAQDSTGLVEWTMQRGNHG